MRSPTSALLRLICLTLLAGPASTSGQERPDASDERPQAPWPAIQAGMRVGYDDGSNATVAGAQIRIPVLRNGWVELMPSADITFLTGLKEYQLQGDIVVLPSGARGGPYVAAGPMARSSIFDGPEREIRYGASLALGFMSRGSGDVPIGTQLEIRWSFIDAPFSPRTLMFGVNLPLWGWGSR